MITPEYIGTLINKPVRHWLITAKGKYPRIAAHQYCSVGPSKADLQDTKELEGHLEFECGRRILRLSMH